MNSVKLQDTKLTYRNLLCIYSDNEISEKLRKHSHLPFHLKMYLGINLHKNAKTCTPKTMTVKEVEDDTNK